MDPRIDMARRLLVADDERLQRAVVSQVMASLGCAAEGIETQAIEAMRRAAGRRIGRGWHLTRRASIPP